MVTEAQQAYTVDRAEAVLRRLRKDLARLELKARTAPKIITFDDLVVKKYTGSSVVCVAYPYRYQP